MKNYEQHHLVPDSDFGWSVIRANSDRISAHADTKAEAERQVAEHRCQEEERRRKAAEAAAELARLRAESAKLAEVRSILKGGAM